MQKTAWIGVKWRHRILHINLHIKFRNDSKKKIIFSIDKVISSKSFMKYFEMKCSMHENMKEFLWLFFYFFANSEQKQADWNRMLKMILNSMAANENSMGCQNPRSLDNISCLIGLELIYSTISHVSRVLGIFDPLPLRGHLLNIKFHQVTKRFPHGSRHFRKIYSRFWRSMGP